MELRDTLALVTGASRGIGRATALNLAQAGAGVGVNYQANAAAAEEVCQRITSSFNGRAMPLQANVANAEQVRRMAAKLTAAFGPVDILVNNAGGAIPGQIDQMTEEQWQEGLAVHLNGAFNCVRAVVEGMKQRRRGVIINVSSVAAIRGAAGNFAYQTVKAALMGFTRGLARDLADFNIRVNCVLPGLIDTDFHAALTPERRQTFNDQRVPLHRFGQPEEVAEAIVALIRNDYITGESLVIDGGLTMRIA